MPETTTPEAKAPKVRKPAYIAAKLHEELAQIDARVTRAESSLKDAKTALEHKLAELKGQSPEVRNLVLAMRGGDALPGETAPASK